MIVSIIALVLLIASSGAVAAAAGEPPLPAATAFATHTCLASAYGAVPSTSHYATAALQAAVDDCSARCGIVVVDQPGSYLTASLSLTGCVWLHLPAGVSLLAGIARRDYGPTQPDWYLLHFHDCSGCGLSGGGTVDGRARLWVLPHDGGEEGERAQHQEEQPEQQGMMWGQPDELAQPRKEQPEQRQQQQKQGVWRAQQYEWAEQQQEQQPEQQQGQQGQQVLKQQQGQGLGSKAVKPLAGGSASAASSRQLAAVDGMQAILHLEQPLQQEQRQQEQRHQKQHHQEQRQQEQRQQEQRQQGQRQQGQHPSPHQGQLPPPRMPRKSVRNWRDPSCLKPEECRPRLVGVVDSADVSISGVTFLDPVYWCLHVLRSVGINISGVTIRGDWNIPNNDGIDVDSSRHISIRHADVDTADDAICLKTTSPGRPLEHVAITDCRLRSRSSAVKLGSESAADMSHISVARLAIEHSHRGLAIQLRDSGNISEVHFTHIFLTTRYYHPSWWGAAEPIYVTAVPRTARAQVGSVENITFSDITATAENGIFMSGGPMPCSPIGGSSSSSSSSMGRSGSSSSSGPASRAGVTAVTMTAGVAAATATSCSNNTESSVQQQQQQPEQQQHSNERQHQQHQQKRHSVRGIRIQRVRLRLDRLSGHAGGCQDYRPSSNTTLDMGAEVAGAVEVAAGAADLASAAEVASIAAEVSGAAELAAIAEVAADNGSGGSSSDGSWWPAGFECGSGSTAAVWLAGADDVLLSDVKVEYCCPPRPDWRQQLHIDAASTAGVELHRVTVTTHSCSIPGPG